MDGLDITEVVLSDLKKENTSFRIDSDFFGKRILSTLKTVEAHRCLFLNPKNIVNGPFGSTITSDVHTEDGYMPLVRSININSGFFISKKDLVYISKENNEIIKHSQLKKDDIVLSRVGSIGFFARVDTDMAVCNISSNNIGIKLDDYAEPEKHYILTYLNTDLAKQLTVRRVSGNVQQKLTVSEICHIPIPVFSNDFYKYVSTLILNSEKARKQSFLEFSAAELKLLSTLELDNAANLNSNIAIKSFSDSYSMNGRLDAEYYQPIYDELFSLLENFDTTSIPDEFDVYKNSGTDYADGYSDIGVIKTKQLTNAGINCDGVESFFDSARCAKTKSTFLVTGDVVFASMGVGSLGKVSLFTYDGDKRFVTDSTLRIYRQKPTSNIKPEVLCVFLQSKIGQELIYRYVVGSTGIINIYDSDIASIPIPVLDSNVQKQIAEKVQESFALRHQSEQLLENAKRAVEIAIEQDEEKAMEWLKEKGVEC